MYCIEKFFPDWRRLKIHESSLVDRGTPLVNKNLPTEWCARIRPDGSIEHLILPPEYHGNPASNDGFLVTVHWEFDIVKFIHESCGLFTEMIYIDALDPGIRAEYIKVLISRKL